METSKRKSSTSFAVGVLEDAEQIKEIADRAFGKGYRSIQEFQELLDQPQGVSVLAKQADQIVGFANSRILTSHSELEEEFMMEVTWIRSKLAPLLPLAIRKGTVVRDGFQSEGIGNELFIKTQQILSNRGCKAIVTPVWINGSEAKVKSMLERLLYFPVAQFDGYWTQDAIEKGYDCPICNKGCVCKMMLYIKLL